MYPLAAELIDPLRWTFEDEVAADGGVANGRVFFDMTAAPGEEALDGMKVDQRGNLYVSGPGGVWIISPAAKHLGTIKTQPSGGTRDSQRGLRPHRRLRHGPATAAPRRASKPRIMAEAAG